MKYPFQFVGGSKEASYNNATAYLKFHAYICDPVKKEEHHLFQANRNGIVETRKRKVNPNTEHEIWIEEYVSVHPVVKIFTSTKGFGVAQEYFSYFFLIDPAAEKLVNIKPLGFDKFNQISGFYFLAGGRFLTDTEILRLYGVKSKTYLFYKRQSVIPARRLRQMVTVVDAKTGINPVPREEVRMLRL